MQVSESERNFEVERVLKAFKLNPWDQLGIEFATPEKACLCGTAPGCIVMFVSAD
jgi:hypothetical protein